MLPTVGQRPTSLGKGLHASLQFRPTRARCLPPEPSTETASGLCPRLVRSRPPSRHSRRRAAAKARSRRLWQHHVPWTQGTDHPARIGCRHRRRHGQSWMARRMSRPSRPGRHRAKEAVIRLRFLRKPAVIRPMVGRRLPRRCHGSANHSRCQPMSRRVCRRRKRKRRSQRFPARAKILRPGLSARQRRGVTGLRVRAFHPREQTGRSSPLRLRIRPRPRNPRLT